MHQRTSRRPAIAGDEHRGRSRRRHGGFPADGGPHGRSHGPRGRRRGGSGRQRGRRGDIRAAILLLLAEQPRHGYEIIGEISERSRGMWRPSPGSIYPTLQLLTDEELVSSDNDSGKRLYQLTDGGRELVATLGDVPPWEQIKHDVDPIEIELRAAATALTDAMRQMAGAGTSTQQAKAVTVLNEARSALYAILGDIETAD